MTSPPPTGPYRAAANPRHWEGSRPATVASVPPRGRPNAARSPNKNPEKASDARAPGFIWRCRMVPSRCCLNRSNSSSGKAGESTISANRGNTTPTRSAWQETAAVVESQPAPAPKVAPSPSRARAHSNPLRRSVPPSRTSAVSSARPARSWETLVSPASRTTRAVTIGRSRFRTSITSRPVSNRWVSRSGNWYGRIRDGTGRTERSRSLTSPPGHSVR